MTEESHVSAKLAQVAIDLAAGQLKDYAPAVAAAASASNAPMSWGSAMRR
jgi:hypothetical protein